MRKITISLLLTLALCASMLLPVFAVTASDEAVKAADRLYALGLFQGVGTNSDGTPNYDLDRAPNRMEAVTMLVRLLGKYAAAKDGSWSIPFTDVADWAKPYVGYAFTNNLTSGTSATAFSGTNTVSASQYLTFVLRALGYSSETDFKWDSAWTLTDKLGITNGEYSANSSFTRGDAVIVSSKALDTKMKGSSKTLLDSINEPTTSEPGQSGDSKQPLDGTKLSTDPSVGYPVAGWDGYYLPNPGGKEPKNGQIIYIDGVEYVFNNVFESWLVATYAEPDYFERD